jgi:hypothetical protein
MSAAYMAGFYEGEGCIDRTSKYGFRITIANTDLDVLQKFKKFAGCGTINPSKKYKSHHKDCWKYRVAKKADVKRIFELMLPWLGERRSYDILNALDTMDQIL